MKTQLFLLTAAVSMSSVLQAVAAPALPPPPAMKAPSKLGAPPAPPSGAVQPASPPKPQIPLLPGGTIANEGKFANPVQGLSARERAEFNVAKSVFLDVETAEGGLGPIFNDVSCVAPLQGRSRRSKPHGCHTLWEGHARGVRPTQFPGDTASLNLRRTARNHSLIS